MGDIGGLHSCLVTSTVSNDSMPCLLMLCLVLISTTEVAREVMALADSGILSNGGFSPAGLGALMEQWHDLHIASGSIASRLSELVRDMQVSIHVKCVQARLVDGHAWQDRKSESAHIL